MRNKGIAALVLASMVCLSIPSAAAAAKNSYAGSESQQKHSAAPDHSCCPGFHQSVALLPFVALTPAPAMPCGDRHPCCARHVPDSPAAVTAGIRVEPSGALNVLASGKSPLNKTTRSGAGPSAWSFSPACSRNPVLRI